MRSGKDCVGNLFYFYRVGDPRNALLNHDFGLSKYAQYYWYLSVKLNHLNDIDSKFEHLIPVFENKESYDAYNNWRSFYNWIQSIKDSALPKEMILSIYILTVQWILFKLKYVSDLDEINEDNIDKFIESKVHWIIETDLFHDTPEYYRENGTNIFLSRFREENIYQKILMWCIDSLEKLSQYKFAVISLLWLIQTQTKISQRDAWFH